MQELADRLKELIEDATYKIDHAETFALADYWRGVRFGLEAALTEVEKRF